jgi:hypothetical protein
MIKIVSFYKDIILEQEKAKKLKQRASFDYEECQKKLFETLQKFNKETCEFIASTDMHTKLYNYPRIERNNLDGKLLMEAVAIANNNFIQKEQGKIILLGSDHLFCAEPSIIFEDKFDIALLIVDSFNSNHYTNVNNTMIVVNSDETNIKGIRKFFKDRLDICLQLPLEERRWYADQKSLSLLLEQESIISEYHQTKKLIHNFRGLKLKLIPWGQQYLKVVNNQGNYKKDTDDVLVDFCGGENIKKHLNNIYQNIMAGI